MQDETVQLPGSPVRQFSIMIQNRVGALTALLGLLEMNGIYCLGFSTHDCHEATIARLIVSDPERASEVFLEKGVSYTDTEILVAALRRGPSGLKQFLDVLYTGEINVNFVYPLLVGCGRDALVAVHVSDRDRGRTLLNSSGFKVLFQQDLSR